MNKTSQIADRFAHLEPIGSVHLHVRCDYLIAIAQRFKRLEEDMQSIVAICGGREDTRKIANLAQQSLDFDPLA